MIIHGLDVLRWAHGGDGVAVPSDGPLKGLVVFVPGSVPGDRVSVKITTRKRRFARGEILEIESPSSGRREPACVVQERCGGCPWMAGDPGTQTAARRTILEGEVRKTLRWNDTILAERVALAPTSGPEYGYRRRVRLAWRRAGRDVLLGYRGRGSHRLVPISRCEVAEESINDALDEVRASIRGLGAATGEVTILAGSNGVGWSMLSESGQRGRGGEETLTLHVNGRPLQVSASGFAQGNGAETSAIAQHLEAFTGLTDGERAVELFAGSGTWTGGLLASGYEVEAYELDGRARLAFEANAAGGTANFYVTDLLETGVPEPPPGEAALLVLDPPRIGAAQLITWLRAVGAPRLFMVSCDVATGLRDTAALCEGTDGYEATQITSYDMFPHTGHQELVIELVRRLPSE